MSVALHPAISTITFADGKHVLDVIGAVTDGTFEDSTTQAPTLTLTVSDPDGVFLHSQLLADYMAWKQSSGVSAPVEVLIASGIRYTLVQAKKQGMQLTLTCEDSAVSRLRTHLAARTFTRGKYTRAQAVRALVAEEPWVGFKSAELNVVEPIASALAATSPGFAKGVALTVKHASATSEQVGNITTILNTAHSLGASRLVMIAAITAATQESSLRTGATNGTHIGLFQMDSAKGTQAQRKNASYAAKWFVNAAMSVVKSQPSIGVVDLCEAVERSGQPKNYTTWVSEATTTVDTYLGTRTSSKTTRGKRRESAPYQFVKKAGVDSWTTINQWATDVNWRCFAVRNTITYDSDDALLKAVPVHRVTETDASIQSIDFDLDAGKAVDTVTITAQGDYWSALPGMPIEVYAMGAADGRYIVTDRQGSIFGTSITVTAERPQPAKPEPAATTTKTVAGAAASVGTISSAGSFSIESDGILSAYDEAVQIAQSGYVYVYGGGHAKLGEPAQNYVGRGGSGFDCSGMVSAILAAGGYVTRVLDTIELNSWGVAGVGQYMTVWTLPLGGTGGHTFIWFDIPGVGLQQFEAHGPQGVGIGRSTPRSVAELKAAGYKPRHVKGQ